MARHEVGGKAARAALIALAFSVTALLAAPLKVQLTNQYEFAFDGLDLLRALLPAFVLAVIGLTALLAWLPGKAQRLGSSTVFMLSALLWIQGNLLVWDYGALDGRDIDWRGMWPYGLLDGSVWAAGLALAWRQSAWISRRLAPTAAVALILIQCAGIYTALTSPDSLDKYQADVAQKYVFSETQNVIVLVVDGFQSDVFQEIIDEQPDLTAVFEGFVYFRNAVAAFRQSFPSVPNMLTGTYFDNSKPMWDYVREAYSGDSSLPRFLLRQGYLSEVYEHQAGMYFHPDVVTNVRLGGDFAQASSEVLYNIDVALFRYLPHFLKPLVYNNQLWLLSRWWGHRRAAADATGDIDRETTAGEPLFPLDDLARLPNLRDVDALVNRSRVGHRRPVFKFFHLHGTHLPLRMNRDFEYVEPEPSRAALKELSVGVIRLLDLVFERFEELGIFDDALIVIAADHGMWTRIAEVRIPEQVARKYPELEKRNRRSLPERKGTALPLVLIKRVGAHGAMRINDAPVALGDIPKTVASELGLEADSFPGVSMFELDERTPRRRVVYFSTFKSNPSYSEPYRSPMTEFVVDGFSWLDSSWHKTGRIYSPAGDDENESSPGE